MIISCTSWLMKLSNTVPKLLKPLYFVLHATNVLASINTLIVKAFNRQGPLPSHHMDPCMRTTQPVVCLISVLLSPPLSKVEFLVCFCSWFDANNSLKCEGPWSWWSSGPTTCLLPMVHLPPLLVRETGQSQGVLQPGLSSFLR